MVSRPRRDRAPRGVYVSTSRPARGKDSKMRALTMIISMALAGAFNSACSPNPDKNCGSTVGCSGDDDPMPDAGDDGQVCEEGEAGCANFGIPSEDGACDDPDYPVVCADWCWPDGTDCDLPWLSCDGNVFRCHSAEQRANCCEGDTYLCPADKPYYCPTSGVCETQACWTEDGRCAYRATECGTI